jgi:hypothetical protein
MKHFLRPNYLFLKEKKLATFRHISHHWLPQLTFTDQHWIIYLAYMPLEKQKWKEKLCILYYYVHSCKNMMFPWMHVLLTPRTWHHVIMAYWNTIIDILVHALSQMVDIYFCMHEHAHAYTYIPNFWAKPMGLTCVPAPTSVSRSAISPACLQTRISKTPLLSLRMYVCMSIRM